jgi:sugar (pentulose or hexulose) kinase
VLGVGEASGMFPIDSKTNDYDERKIELFNERLKAEKIAWKLQDILPKVLVAGDAAGALTAEGARLLDPVGQLQAGIPLCPPEGDAGTVNASFSVTLSAASGRTVSVGYATADVNANAPADYVAASGPLIRVLVDL